MQYWVYVLIMGKLLFLLRI